MSAKVNGVFKGGGAKGAVYSGALKACEDLGLEFKAVSGSSAGAITALLVACGYDARSTAHLLPQALRCLDGLARASWRLRRSSLYTSNELGHWLDARVSEAVDSSKSGPPVTFEQLFDHSGVELFVVTMNLATRQPVVFSHVLSPDMSVAKAVVASCAIPVAFPPIRMVSGGSVVRLVDGGVWANYPSFVFLDHDFRAAHDMAVLPSDDMTIGFVIEDNDSPHSMASSLAPATHKLQFTDRGSASRELGAFGAIVNSSLGRLSLFVLPLLAAWLMLDWQRRQTVSGFPAFSSLPPLLSDLAVLTSFGAVVFLSAIGFLAALAALRLGPAITDTGLGGAVAAMGVGPSIPYWVGETAGHPVGTNTNAHVVVRIRPPDRLKTLSFSASTELLNESIRLGHASTMTRLGSLVAVDASAHSAPIVLDPESMDTSTWLSSLLQRVRNVEQPQVDDAKERKKKSASRKNLEIAVVGSFFLAVLAMLGAMGFQSLVFSQAMQESDSERTTLILLAGIAVVGIWLYGKVRQASARAQTTFLRSQSTVRLVVFGVVGLALSSAAFLLPDRQFSLRSNFDAIPLSAEIVRASTHETTFGERQNFTVQSQSFNLRCGVTPRSRYRYTNQDSSFEVGDPIAIVLLPNNCQIWQVSRFSEEIWTGMFLSIFGLAFFAIPVNCALALRWRRMNRLDLEAPTGMGSPP